MVKHYELINPRGRGGNGYLNGQNINPFLQNGGLNIALFSNNKPNTDYFFSEVEAYFSTHHAVSKITRIVKQSGALGASEELLNRIKEEANCVIIGTAD